MVKRILAALRELKAEPQTHAHKADVTLRIKVVSGEPTDDSQINVRELENALNAILEDEL